MTDAETRDPTLHDERGKRLGRLLPDADSLHYRVVAGDHLTIPLFEFMNRCAARITEEQAKPNPDNACIALWCEAIRLGRECCTLLREDRL